MNQILWSSALLISLALTGGCGGGGSGGGGSSAVGGTPPPPPEVTVGGSVGDGPQQDSEVQAESGGEVLVTITSDEQAKYSLTFGSDVTFPVNLTATTSGTDLVTGEAPVFTLSSIVFDANQTVANINLVTTLLVKIAACSGSLGETDVQAAIDVLFANFSFGLDRVLVPDPIRTPIDATNVAHTIKANEAIGETLRRAATALNDAGRAVSAEEVLDFVACDLTDGAIDGVPAGADADAAAAVNLAMAQVLIETLQSRLRVGGQDATAALDAAIAAVEPEVPPGTGVNSVPLGGPLIDQAGRALAVVAAQNPSRDLVALIEAVRGLAPGSSPGEARVAISDAGSQLVDAALAGFADLDDPSISEVNQNAARGIAAGAPVLERFSADPPGRLGPGPATLSWDGQNLAVCAVDEADGQVFPDNTRAVQLDATTTFDLTCVGVDGQTVTAQLTVRAENNAPTVTQPLADLSLAEDAPDVLIDLGSVFTDVDAGFGIDELSFSVVANDNPGLFATTNIADGMLSLGLTPNASGVANLTVRALDQGRLQVDDSFSVSVAPVDDPPFIANSIPDQTLDEDGPNIVLDVSNVFDDIDSPPPVLSIASNSNAALFNAVVLAGSTLTLDLAPDRNGVAQITLRGTSDGLSANEAFVVTVNPINDAPSVVAPVADIVVDEDAPASVVDLNAVFADPDIATNADSLAFSVTGNTNPSLFSALDIAGGALSIRYGPDQNGTAGLTIRARDSAGAFAEDVFAVTVNAVDDPPFVAAPIADQNVSEDAPNLVLDLSATFDDIDSAAPTLSVEQNSNPGLFDLVDVAGGVLTLDFAPDLNGSADITIGATADGQSVSDTFRVDVAAVNDPPVVVMPLSDLTVSVNTPNTDVALAPAFDDVDIATNADSLSFSLEGNTNPGLFASVALVDSTLTFGFQQNQNGNADVTVRATDQAAAFAEDTFTVTVLPGALQIMVDPALVNFQGTTTVTYKAPAGANCTASGAWSGARTPTGDFQSETSGPLDEDTEFVLTCNAGGEILVGSAPVNVRSARATWTAPTLEIDGDTLTDLCAYRLQVGTSLGKNDIGEFRIPSDPATCDPSQTTILVPLPDDVDTTYFFMLTAEAGGGDTGTRVRESKPVFATKTLTLP